MGVKKKSGVKKKVGIKKKRGYKKLGKNPLKKKWIKKVGVEKSGGKPEFSIIIICTAIEKTLVVIIANDFLLLICLLSN